MYNQLQTDRPTDRQTDRHTLQYSTCYFLLRRSIVKNCNQKLLKKCFCSFLCLELHLRYVALEHKYWHHTKLLYTGCS